MSKQVNRFWIVMRVATQPVRVPRNGYYRHESQALAEREAQRLTERYNEPFVVLGVTAAFGPKQPVYIPTERLRIR